MRNETIATVLVMLLCAGCNSEPDMASPSSNADPIGRAEPRVSYAARVLAHRNPAPETVGLYDPATSSFLFTYSTSSNPAEADLSVQAGRAGLGWIPIAGDWDGNGSDTIGLYDPATSTFFLLNSNENKYPDLIFVFRVGMHPQTPVVGDWNGDGVDTIGLFDPATSTFCLCNSNEGMNPDLVFVYGEVGEQGVPIVGDWNGDGMDTVGVYLPQIATFLLSNSNEAKKADLAFVYGAPHWVPLAGDWDGDGIDTVGAYVPECSTFFLCNTNETKAADITLSFGVGGKSWIPLAGKWRGPDQGDLLQARLNTPELR